MKGFIKNPDGIRKGDKVVVWEKVKSNDPILTMNWREMKAYIEYAMNYYSTFVKDVSSGFDEFYNRSPQFGDLMNWFERGMIGRYSDGYVTQRAREIAKTLCLPKYYIKYMGTLIPLEFNINEVLDKVDYLVVSDYKHHK